VDVEQTIEFIPSTQAKSEARADKFDKRLEAMRKLVETGMKMLVRIEKNHVELQKDFLESKNDFDRRFKELVEAQKKTDQKLDRLIDSWTKRGSNGRRH
jgi:hypothetical protein